MSTPKDELINLLLNNKDEFAAKKADLGDDTDLSEAELSGADISDVDLSDIDFSGCILNGTNFSYATLNFCNFNEADMAGCVLNEAELTDSDFATSENLSACRFDEGTIWPDNDKLPEDFDSTYNYDLSSLQDEDENQSNNGFDY